MASFQKATIAGSYLRLALLGPSGSGKTYTALSIMQHLVDRVALIDTEHRSASKYADQFTFDTAVLESFEPRTYIQTIRDAAKAGYPGLIIDSLSHAWSGPGGILEYVDNYAKRNRGDGHSAWREATPQHNDLVEALLAFPGHLIVTMRVKMEYAREQDPKTGKTIIRKVGLQPVQREGLEYEFDVIGDVDMEHNLVISKTRCFLLTDKVFHRAGQEVADILRPWLAGDGTPPPVPTPAPAAQPSQANRPAPVPANGGNGNGRKQSPTQAQVDALQEIMELARMKNADGTAHFTAESWRAWWREAYDVEAPKELPASEWPKARDLLLDEQAIARGEGQEADALDSVEDPFAEPGQAGDQADPEDPADVAGAQIERIGELVAAAGLAKPDGNWMPDMFRVLAHLNLKKKKLLEYSVAERQTLIDNLQAAVDDPAAREALLASRSEGGKVAAEKEPVAAAAASDEGPGF